MELNELKRIEHKYPNDSYRCLFECLEAWLKLSGRTWEMLGDALEKINEIDASSKIRNSCMTTKIGAYDLF